ncbi:MAG: NUDIX domain-containing protein [Alphaproteobacteria bacterium]|nr:NUDIX domain-containing protein [Alphaproteobacteria bacterium]
MDAQITIPAIDASGRLYPIEKLTAHRDGGVLHLAISIFVFSKGRLLLQRRAPEKYHSGGLWANTCCTHPDWGEDLTTAAHRRLREEMGLDVPTLEERAVIDYHARVSDELWERERVHVFQYVSREPLATPAHAASEVCETSWMAPADIRRAMARSPESFAPWFRIYMDRWDELNLT